MSQGNGLPLLGCPVPRSAPGQRHGGRCRHHPQTSAGLPLRTVAVYPHPTPPPRALPGLLRLHRVSPKPSEHVGLRCTSRSPEITPVSFRLYKASAYQSTSSRACQSPESPGGTDFQQASDFLLPSLDSVIWWPRGFPCAAVIYLGSSKSTQPHNTSPLCSTRRSTKGPLCKQGPPVGEGALMGPPSHARSCAPPPPPLDGCTVTNTLPSRVWLGQERQSHV